MTATLPTLADALGDWLAWTYGTSTLLLGVATAVLAALRSPARRRLVARSTLAALGLVALGSAAVVAARVATPDPPPIVVVHDHPAPTLGRFTCPDDPDPLAVACRANFAEPKGCADRPATARRPEACDGSITPVSVVAHAKGPPPFRPWPLGFAAGASVCLAWLGLGAVEARRLRRRGRSAGVELRSLLPKDGPSIDLIVSPQAETPLVLGLSSPTVVLPAEFVAAEPSGRLAAALAHEVAHVAHGDLAWLSIARWLLPLYFAHPGYWWLRRVLRQDQEALADAVAAGDGPTGRVAMAEALLDWARRGPAPRQRPAAALALWGRPSALRRRVECLLDAQPVELACPRTWRVAVAGLLVVVPSAFLGLAAAHAATPAPVGPPVKCSCGIAATAWTG